MVSKMLGGLGRVLMWSGALILAFVAFQLWGTGIEERAHQDEVGASFARSLESTGALPSADERLDALAEALEQLEPKTVGPMAAPPIGDGAGIIEIPKIGLNRFFVEGVSKAELKKGPGHYPGTPLPGQAGNASIAGHRTTYGAPFNRIDEMVPGDRINTYTPQGRFVYEVIAPPQEGIENGPGFFTVVPSQSEVITDQGDNRLTLTSCHPKYSAKQRIIVTAKLIGEAAPSPEATTATTATDATVAADFDEGFAGESTALRPAILWGIGAHIVVLLALWLAKRWRRWPVAIVATPIFVFGIWNCFYWLNRYLPAL